MTVKIENISKKQVDKRKTKTMCDRLFKKGSIKQHELFKQQPVNSQSSVPVI